MALLEVIVKRGIPQFRRNWLSTLVVAGCLLCTGASAQETLDRDRATALKVAYLRYIAEYTLWPEEKRASSPGAPLDFCVLGHDVEGMAGRIDELIVEAGIRIQNRPVHLRILRRGILPFLQSQEEWTESIRSCHLLYVSPSEKDRWGDLNSRLEKIPVVTVSDMEDFAREGGMIQFVLTPDPSGPGMRYTLHINLKTCLRAGLRLSAKLLNLKQTVKIVEPP